jgi:multidrug efflux pump subunit AcrA (membrane-fusion protein)
MTTNLPIPRSQQFVSNQTTHHNTTGLFRPTKPEEFLPPISVWTTVGGLGLVAIFGSAIALSTVLKYKVTIQAPAAIRPVGELRIVQSGIEGAIASIQVKENQVVRQGDVIATLNDTRLQSKITQLQGDLQKGNQQIVAIDAQTAAFDRQIAAEKEQIDRSVAGVRSERQRYEREYRDKQITSKSEVAEADANYRTAEKERRGAEVELQVADANLKSIEAGYKSAVTKRDRYQSAVTEGAISQNQLEEAQLAAEQQLQSIAAQKATIAKQKENIARLQNATQAAVARWQRSQAGLNPSTAEIASSSEKIARERAIGNSTIARLQKEREQMLQQRMEIGNQLGRNQEDIKQLGTELQSTVIRASYSGIIQDLNLRNTGQIVRPGDRITQIVPSDAPLTIEASVTSGDIGKVKVGQTVQMRVSACPYTDHGVLSGKVVTISPDAKLPNKETADPGQQRIDRPNNPTYQVMVRPAATALTTGTGKTKCQVQAGMDGRVDIISKEETVLQFMLRKARLLVTI